jgi:hypothetical protein
MIINRSAVTFWGTVSPPAPENPWTRSDQNTDYTDTDHTDARCRAVNHAEYANNVSLKRRPWRVLSMEAAMQGIGTTSLLNTLQGRVCLVQRKV